MKIDEHQRKLTTELLDNLISGYGFMEFLQDRQSDDWMEWCRDYNHAIYDEFDFVHLYHGVTKGVIVDDRVDYVLKFSFSNYECDACDVEYQNYQNAIEFGIEECFAACDIITTIPAFGEEIVVYAQERADCGEDLFNETIASDYPDLYKEYDGDTDDEEFVEIILEEEWGTDIFGRYVGFIDEYNINDIHSGNVGYVDGRLVVIDFSGYHN